MSNVLQSAMCVLEPTAEHQGELHVGYRAESYDNRAKFRYTELHGLVPGGSVGPPAGSRGASQEKDWVAPAGGPGELCACCVGHGPWSGRWWTPEDRYWRKERLAWDRMQTVRENPRVGSRTKAIWHVLRSKGLKLHTKQLPG